MDNAGKPLRFTCIQWVSRALHPFILTHNAVGWSIVTEKMIGSIAPLPNEGEILSDGNRFAFKTVWSLGFV